MVVLAGENEGLKREPDASRTFPSKSVQAGLTSKGG